MRQLVGPVVQLAIAQAQIAMHHSDRLRGTLDLGFEQAVEGLL
ncbi:hypothetical protein ALO42_200042 [Pseudomonas syringae pv. atrofaciens]|nr:hypothetical protein ALO42_200042 [Pseudomonas syringae pv. atrofaciens]